jgi:bifunctional non-homologous end joining protein LigD
VMAKKSTARAAAKTPSKRPSKPAARHVEFSNVDKVMFPEAGVTKGELIQFYLEVADKLIPHLRDRPVTLERLPDGVAEGKPRFWQKNTPDYYPSWIPRVELPSGEGKRVHYVLVNDAETLAYLVNQGTITFHPYLSRVSDLDRPDFVLFDLDPSAATFKDVVRVARTLHEVLGKAAVESFPKTSGKSGLHVMVPWDQPGDFDAARAWAMKTAGEVVKALPEVATTERLKAKRGSRVYVDVIQNGPGKHAVPPYVVRATPGATVSTPLEWKEVTAKLDPKRFDVRTAPRRFAKARQDPLIVLTGG